MSQHIVKKIVIVILCYTSIITTSVADENKNSFIESVVNTISKANSKSNTLRALIFTAPPRNKKKDVETYTPIVEYLSKTLNRKIEYRKPTGWGDYNKAMINDVADIVFDGPHFNAWRMDYLGHKIIVRLPQQQVWKIIAAAGSSYRKVEHLTGQKACLQGATNYGKLNYMKFFPNVMRLPEIIQIKSRLEGYNEVVKGRCAATIVTAPELDKYNKLYLKERSGKEPPVKVLKTLKPSPNQAFSVSARLSSELQLQIQKALLSPEGQEAMSVLRDRYAKNELLIAAEEQDYKDVSDVLIGSYPFDNPFNKPIADAYGVGEQRRHKRELQERREEYLKTVKEHKFH